MTLRLLTHGTFSAFIEGARAQPGRGRSGYAWADALAARHGGALRDD